MWKMKSCRRPCRNSSRGLPLLERARWLKMRAGVNPSWSHAVSQTQTEIRKTISCSVPISDYLVLREVAARRKCSMSELLAADGWRSIVEQARDTNGNS